GRFRRGERGARIVRAGAEGGVAEGRARPYARRKRPRGARAAPREPRARARARDLGIFKARRRARLRALGGNAQGVRRVLFNLSGFGGSVMSLALENAG